jgi:NAD(P)H-nitrite reductase large subunit
MEAIRSVDSTGEIILIGDDPHAFYSRPGLAYFLTGELSEIHLFPYKREDYQRMKVRYLRDRATKINAEGRLVTLQQNGAIGYDRLLVAVGSKAVPLNIPGSDLEGVVKLDHLEDARRILKLARWARTAVVIGGGITALEIVEGLVANRTRVHYLLRGDRYWPNVLDEDESRIVEERLKHEGIQLHKHSEAVEVLGKRGKVKGVRLADGRQIKCDLVGYGIGIKPRTSLAREAGLTVDRGVMVDDGLRTNLPDIFAAGDVAQVYDPLTGKAMVDSLWNPAREQGYVAGLNMAGQNRTYRKVAPFNVTRLAGLTTTIIGTVGSGRDEDLVGIARGDSETWRSLPHAIIAQSGFDVNRLRLLIGQKSLLGAIVMGDQTLSRPLQQLVISQADISSIRDSLLAPNAPVADLIATFWTNWRTQYAQ